MANPDLIRRGLIALLNKLSNDIPIGGATKPLPKGTGPGPNVLSEAGGVQADDIFAAPGQGIRMSDEAAAKSRKLVTGEAEQHVTSNIDEITLDNILDDEIVKSQVQRTRKGRPGTKGPLARGLRQEEEIDFEGQQFEKGVADVEGIMAKEIADDPLFPNPQHPRSQTRQAITKTAKATEINREVQDVVNRFKSMFDVEKIKKATKQGSTESKLRDGWNALSNAAAGARAGNPEALEKVRAINTWLIR